MSCREVLSQKQADNQKQQHGHSKLQPYLQETFRQSVPDIGLAFILDGTHDSKTGIEQEHDYHHLVQVLAQHQIGIIVWSAQSDVLGVVAEKDQDDEDAFDVVGGGFGYVFFLELAGGGEFQRTENSQ